VRRGLRARRFWLVVPLVGMAGGAAGAHSASDAYLTLTADDARTSGHRVIHGQWDIALRDLDFVLKLDDDGDGQLTWGEVKGHQAAIERYAYARLEFGGDPANPCSIKPVRQLIDAHADGAYAALFFDVVCLRSPKSLTMNYRIFFDIDPSHRGIFVMRAGENTSTAVLSPENARVALALE
jgi:hypothetical protein